MPFYIIELADFLSPTDKGGRTAWAEFRKAQAEVADTYIRSGKKVLRQITGTESYTLKPREFIETFRFIGLYCILHKIDKLVIFCFSYSFLSR